MIVIDKYGNYMKINKNARIQIKKYNVQSKYGLLECAFYPEQVSGHFFDFFSLFANDLEDYLSSNPSFEQYADMATEIFAEQLPKRIEELLEEIVDEARIRTLSKIGKISRSEAKLVIDKAVKDAVSKKKTRLNAPSSGRPKKSDRDILREAIIEQIKKAPRLLNPTLGWVANKLNLGSGDALRKELKRHKLKWKELKKRT